MESIVPPSDDRNIYTKRAMIIRSLLLFVGYVFVFLAGASEVRDVLLTFLGIQITPRQALLIISLLQMMIWMFTGFYPLYKDKSFTYIGYLSFMFFIIFLSVETEAGALMFGSFAPGFRALGTIYIFLNIFVAAGYTSMNYYSNNYQKAK